jgi:hypothetical protein
VPSFWDSVLGWLRGAQRRLGGAPRLAAAGALPSGTSVRLVDANADEERGERLHIDEQRKGIRTPWVPVNLEWKFDDIDRTWEEAEIGLFTELAKMIEAMRLGGAHAGLMSTRTSMVRLPVNFTGDPFLCALLRGESPKFDSKGNLISSGKRGIFRKMFPTPALIDLLYTGILGGLAPAEFVDDPETKIPVLHTRDLHFLRYDWAERVYKFKGSRRDYVVKPGDGRWLMFMPESTHRPWRSGRWLPLALAFVVMLSSVYDRARYQAKHADPLKLITFKEGVGGVGDDDMQRLEDFVTYYWERAPGLVLKYGADAKLVETQGLGYQIYRDQFAWAERQILFALSGQTVTGDGKGGLSDGGDLFRDIKDDLIAATAEALGETISEQGLASWAYRVHSIPRDVAPIAAWDTRSSARRLAEAEAAGKVAEAVEQIDAQLLKRGRRVNIDEYFQRQGLTVPTEPLPAEPPPLPGASTPDGTVSQ